MEYPRNLREFDRLFEHKDACLRFLEKVRWGDHFRCQKCGAADFWPMSTGLRRCRQCRFKNSVKTGTIFESSRLPLKMWFYAIWWITAQKSGVSALDLQKDVGLGSYRSAWLLLHKIRNAMTRADHALLEGEVELGELLFGQKRVLVAVERAGPKRAGRIRAEKLAVANAEAVGNFLRENVLRGATIRTGDGALYATVSSHGYRHMTENARRALPILQIVREQLQRWVKGTLHGRVDAKHLSSYLEEFVFRFNSHVSKSRGTLFQRVLENAVRIEPASYAKIVKRGTPVPVSENKPLTH